MSDRRDDETIAIFEAINKPAVALARQAVATTFQRIRTMPTKSRAARVKHAAAIKSAQIMAAYLRSLAGAL